MNARTVLLSLGIAVSGATTMTIAAATITVTTTANSPGGAADCTLGEAITAANSDAAVDGCTTGLGADTINVPAGTYTLTTALPQINSIVTIQGVSFATTIIIRDAAAPPFRIFDASGGSADTTLNDLDIVNGLIAGDAGVYTRGRPLVVNDSRFRDNTATNGNGGAIATSGFLGTTTINNTINGNNLIGNTDGSTVILLPSDIAGTGAAPVNPRLGPLQNNGGPTQTHALETGSPAIVLLGIEPGQADVSITKTAAPPAPTVGGNITYTIVVTNTGPDSATSVIVTDPVPTGTTLVSSSSTQGTCSGTTTVTCSVGTLTNSGTATITIVVATTTAGPVVNIATVAAAQTDPDGTDNTGQVTTQVGALALTAIPTLDVLALLAFALCLAAAAVIAMRST